MLSSLNTEVPNGNRFNDVNTGIQVAQCSSATVNLNPRPSDTSAHFPDKENPILTSDLVSTSNYSSSNKMQRFGTNFKFQKNRSRTTLRSQAKNEFSFPCIPIFDNL